MASGWLLFRFMNICIRYFLVGSALVGVFLGRLSILRHVLLGSCWSRLVTCGRVAFLPSRAPTRDKSQADLKGGSSLSRFWLTLRLVGIGLVWSRVAW